MLLYNFKNFEEFKELFVREDGQRKNGILLDALKSKELIHNEYYGKCIRKCRTMCDLEVAVRRVIVIESTLNLNKRMKENRLDIPTMCVLYSDKYKLDDFNGVCEDRDIRCIRYVNCETGKAVKMKFGRFLKHLFDENGVTSILPNKIILWFIEEASRQWEAYSLEHQPPVFDFHFEEGKAAMRRIYNDANYRGDFGSCMSHMSGGRHGDFYAESTDAKAAWLEDESGNIVARCVVFTNVEDCETGEIYSIAERQYSTDGRDDLKRLLVNKLIQEKLIDAYKRVGADCHSPHNFVGVDGSDWSRKDMKIRCDLESGDVNAYLDSFKFYDLYEHVAYNDDAYHYDFTLDSTDDYFGAEWDDYYEESCSEVFLARRDGREYHVSSENVNNGDWTWVESEDIYVWSEDVFTCPHCGAYFDINSSYRCYSELLERDFCCSDCMEAAEQEYKSENWYYSSYDDEYYENEDDVTTWVNDEGDVETISVESLAHLNKVGHASTMCVSDRFVEQNS